MEKWNDVMPVLQKRHRKPENNQRKERRRIGLAEKKTECSTTIRVGTENKKYGKQANKYILAEDTMSTSPGRTHANCQNTNEDIYLKQYT